jgi:glycosyltransferase involved in cell wall biosynthesis
MTSHTTYGLLVPCRNGARYLPRLFDSMRAQTRPFDQFWFFDDGSDDDSGALAERAGARVIRADRSGGPSAARNRLAAECNCTWLHFHDADDTMAPNYLERISSFASEAIDLVVCDMLWIEEATGRVDNLWRYDQAALTRHPAASLLVNTIGGINGLYRRAPFLAAGGFDESLTYWEDMELNLRLFARGIRCAVVNEDLVTAYRRTASYSNSNLGEVWRVKLRIMRSLLAQADAELKATIAREAETIADRFALLDSWHDVPTALALGVEAGGDPPATRSLALRLLKHILPRRWSFRLQHYRRRRETR